jgi:hypothetical protein
MSRIGVGLRAGLALAVSGLGLAPVGIASLAPTLARAAPVCPPGSYAGGDTQTNATCVAKWVTIDYCNSIGGSFEDLSYTLMDNQKGANFRPHGTCFFRPAGTLSGGGGGSAGPGNGIPAGGFGNGYVPVTGAPGTTARYNQLTNNSFTAINGALGYLPAKQAEDEQRRAEAAAQAEQEEEARQAQLAEQRAQAAAADARSRASMANVFAGEQPVSSPDNPFATPGAGAAAGAPGGGGAGSFQVASANDNPFGGGAGTESAAPRRKLGAPGDADGLAPMTWTQCQSTPRAEVIKFPEGAAYCVVEVDQPEPTNQWRHLIGDPPPLKLQPTATMGPRG